MRGRTPRRTARAGGLRLTVGGRCTAYAVAAAGLVTLALGNPWLGAVAAAAAAVLLTGLLLRPRLDGLVVEVDGPLRTVAGATVEHLVTVRATAGHRARGTGAARLVLRTSGLADAEVAVPALAPGACAAVAVARLAVHRAATRLGTVHVLATDPFGVVAREALHPVAHRVVVHPSAPDGPRAPLPTGETRAAASRPAGHPDGIRPWRSGDRPADVHWRSTARRGVPVAREREPACLPRLAVVLDGPLGTPAGAHPDAAHGEVLLGRLGQELAGQARTGREVAVLANMPGGAVVTAGLDRAPAGATELLDWLAALGPATSADEELLARARRWAGPGGTVLLASCAEVGVLPQPVPA
ncbi:uncharacterized protein DUF58 [Kineococcus xinjiangensis]|uniref:Uncharacterized protein DUF58 n=1 Tax=Kineococcus xinjiangensis TaxID=512762 RepID=A0A2S6IJY6_9ACTN|nr:DUF58 domain-containing protein [Kineococcus xinjiangensis]PPK94543.1 uncharacterized protein DUF58 [Kineococcus xinjiangensis]